MKLLKKRILILFFAPLIIVGVFARAVEVINKNYIWGFDHGRDYLLVKEIIDEKNLRLIGTPLGAGSAGFQGIFHGPGYYYFLAIPYILFNGDPYGGVVLMFLFGISALILGYVLGRKIFGYWGGFIVASLLSLSPPLIAQSRAIWNSYPTTPFVILSLYFTYLFTSVKKIKYRYIFFAAFFAAFTYNFEFAVAVPLSLGLLFYSIYFFRKKIKFYAYLILGFLVGYAPMLLFEIKHTFMAVRGMITYIALPPSKDPNSLNFVENNIDHYGSFVFNFLNTFPKQNVLSGSVLLVILLTLFIIALRTEKDVALKKFLLYLASLVVVSFLVFSLLRNAVYEYYLVHLNVVYILIFSYLLVAFFRNKSKLKFVASGLLLLFVFWSVPQYVKMIQYDLKDKGGDAKIIGKKEVIDFVYTDAKGEEFGLFVFTPPVYTYPYDYLIEWYGQEKYGYKPHANKEGLFYLIMEVDSTKPWSHEGWMETVIIDGEVVKEWKLSTGVIVQKRIQ